MIIGVRCLKISRNNYNKIIQDTNSGIAESYRSDNATSDKNDSKAAYAYIEPDKFKRSQNDSILKEQLHITEKEIENIKLVFKSEHSRNHPGTTFIVHKNVPLYINSSAFYTYIKLKDSGSMSMPLVVRYYGDSLMFVDKISIKADNSTFHLVEKMGREYDVYSVWEWLEIEPNVDQLLMIQTIVNSEITRIRFQGGKYHKDWILTQKEIVGLKDTLLYYRLLIRKRNLEELLNI